MIRAFYAIRHLPSGGFLPEVHKGYTFSEPSTKECDVPRLFTTKAGAKRALSWWLKGITMVHRSRDYEGEYDETWQLDAQPHRKAENMEIALVLLKS